MRSGGEGGHGKLSRCGKAFDSTTHLGGDLLRAVVPHDDLGDHILQTGVAEARSDQDDISKSTPIEDNCRYSGLFIIIPRSPDRIKGSVVDADVRSSIGGQRREISWIIGMLEYKQSGDTSPLPRLKDK